MIRRIPLLAAAVSSLALGAGLLVAPTPAGALPGFPVGESSPLFLCVPLPEIDPTVPVPLLTIPLSVNPLLISAIEIYDCLPGVPPAGSL
jgi:hypothetical protein